jgi:nitroreductase
MKRNAIIDAMLDRKSIREYKTDMPSDEVIETIVRAGMQAPFAAQMYSILLRRNNKNISYDAPLEFFICADVHKLELIIEKRGWTLASNDFSILLFAIQDAILAAQNMVMAAESLGMGSCFIGAAPYIAEKIAVEFELPERVFPIVSLVMGYPAENPPVRPRYPLEFVLFEGKYPKFNDDEVSRAMKEMDDGYLAQDYYRKAKYMVELEEKKEETFTYDNYSWTEHMGRKWGQWLKSPQPLLEQMSKCGFRIPSPLSADDTDNG